MANRRIRLKNPHFFKPVLLASFLQLSIPNKFLEYLEGEKGEGKAILNSSNRGKSWPVKMNGLQFQEGWNDFVRDHDLRVGDFLVFRYEGGLVFNVMVFDATACEREYPPSDFKEINDGMTEKKEQIGMMKARKNFEGLIFTADSDKDIRVEESSSSATAYPQFKATIKHYNLRDHNMRIPAEFARSNGLKDKECKMILKDKIGISWEAMLSTKKNCHTSQIKSGWRAFSDANNLKKGDVCTFKLISGGLKPVMEVTVSRSTTTI